jgi:ankyrin repeat protein
MWSSATGKLDVTRFLVESKANVEAKNNRYYTPITLPFKSSTPLQFGSIFLISVFSGSTALICSSMNGRPCVTRFLVESKADVAARSK